MDVKRIVSKPGKLVFMKTMFFNSGDSVERLKEDARICIALLLAATGLLLTVALEIKLFS